MLSPQTIDFSTEKEYAFRRIFYKRRERILWIFIIILLGFIGIIAIAVAASGQAYKELKEFMQTQHTIRAMEEKIYNHITEKGKISGWFFLFLGSISGAKRTQGGDDLYVQFAWEYKNSEIVLSKIPLTKIRLQFAEIETPCIEFFLVENYIQHDEDGPPLNHDDIQDVFDRALNYARITCKKEDWSPVMRLPLSSREILQKEVEEKR